MENESIEISQKLKQKKRRVRRQLFLLISLSASIGFSVSLILHKIFHIKMWIRFPISISITYLLCIFLINKWVNLYIVKKKILINDELGDKKQSSLNKTNKVSDKDDVLVDIVGGLIEGLAYIFIVFVLVFSFIYYIFSVLLDFIIISIIINYIILKVKHKQSCDFSELLFKKTIIPITIFILIISISAFFIQYHYPNIDTIGAVFKPLILKLHKLWMYFNT